MEDRIILGIAVAVVAILLYLLSQWINRMHTIKQATMYKGSFDNRIVIQFEDGHIEEYIGHDTYWKELPYYDRVNTLMRSKLAMIEQYCSEHGNPYPYAHELKEIT
jgi:hypothetical protein